MASKRKADQLDSAEDSGTVKKLQTSIAPDARAAFRADLFEPSTLQSFHKAYAESGPYPHAVVSTLIEDALLRSVRTEIISHIHFTLKETDIYRIHQSGDLANLSNLDKASLRNLPSLVRLRDALYSYDFREWVSEVTGAGKLSGKKTDMAVNVYTPGSYLLCHDDVIGSRRVSYILYLTDPDKPWQARWGGGLRLYPTESKKNRSGEDIQVPLAEHSVNIPPSFGQLSFFTVVPGESYHDVEEVYHGPTDEDDENRIRMAISGWFHIPQEGEEGFEEGIEQALAQKSSLTQLKGAAHEFDEPQVTFQHFDEARLVMNSSATAIEIDPGDKTDRDEDILTEQDLTFLLQYIKAQYLTPDMIEQVSRSFEETSMLQLEQFLCDKFAAKMKSYINRVEDGKDRVTNLADNPTYWKVARPPHKHRFAYQQEGSEPGEDSSPISKLLADVLRSHAFKKWLALITGLKTPSLTRQHAVARRFRRGHDYALASAFPGEQPQLEFTISLTPSLGWDSDREHVEKEKDKENGDLQNKGLSEMQVAKESAAVQVDVSNIEHGGEEVYMAGDDEDDNESIHSKSLPQVGKKADPAVYRAAADDEEDGILFANAPAWNQFSAVLRDRGTLRFVKYVSEAAKGDRWDIKGEVELADDAFADEDDDLDVDEDENEEEEGEEEEGEEEEEEAEEEEEEGYDDDDDEQ